MKLTGISSSRNYTLKTWVVGLGSLLFMAPAAWGLDLMDSSISKVEVINNDATHLTKAGLFSSANLVSHQLRGQRSLTEGGQKNPWLPLKKNEGSISIKSNDFNSSLLFTPTKAPGCESTIEVDQGETKEISIGCFPIKDIKIIENRSSHKNKTMKPCKGHKSFIVAMKEPGHYELTIHKIKKYLIDVKGYCYKIYKHN